MHFRQSTGGILLVLLFPILGLACRSAAPPITPVPEIGGWAVWIEIEPLNVSPTEYKCTATVTKPATGEILQVPVLVVTPGKIAFARLPAGPNDRQGQFDAFISPTAPVLQWHLFVRVGKVPIINTSAHIDVRPNCPKRSWQ